MATLEELYRYYLNQPITYVPGSTIGGLSSLTEINRNDAGGDSMGASPVTSINTDPNVTNTTPGTGIMGTNINFSDIGKAIGFAMNPALGIANLAATQVFGKSPMDMAMEAMGIGGFGRTDSDFATAGVFGGDDSSSTGTANATDTGDMGSEAANDAASASAAAGGSGGGGGGADSAGDGGDGYATGGRIGYAEGGISQEGVIPGFEKIRDTVYFNPDGTPNLEKIKAANFLPGSSINEFGYRDIKTGDTYGQSTYADIASGRYPRIFDPSKYTIGPDNNYYEVDSIITDGGLRYRINADGSRTLLDTTIAQTTPTEDFSDYLNTTTINTNVQTAPTIAEQIISKNNSSPTLTSVAEKLFPQGDFLNIKETATSPTEYNIKATEDLVKNLPGGIVKNIVAPTAAFALSLPYDTIQAYQRMEPGSGIGGFKKALQAERPLESAFERFTGAAGPLAGNINTAISSLNPFQKQQYMNYAVQNPEQAIAAAQQNKDFLAATQKNIAPATTPAPASMAAGGRVFYLQGGLASLLR
jgi:hypothetical protein